MADLSQKYLEIYLDETDMENIEVGYEVDVTFDALPDQDFSGHVTQIDPSLYRSGMVSTVRAYAVLDGDSSMDTDRMLLGMSASVDVIAGKAENVVLVPVEALHELSPGEYAVFVQDSNGELKLRPVEVGLMDITFAEIKSGLEAGEIVSTGIVETQ
jgi:multidrug efflux pump subunit AcrA (membrane-fusion protein)